MADKLTTTPDGAAEHLNPILTEDRLTFRTALDHFQKALRSDWIVFQHGNDLESPAGMERGHAAATEWDAFLTGLQTLSDLTDADDDLRAAAQKLSKIAPSQMPDVIEIGDVGVALIKLSNKNKRLRPAMSELLLEAWALTEAYRGNLELMTIPRVA